VYGTERASRDWPSATNVCHTRILHFIVLPKYIPPKLAVEYRASCRSYSAKIPGQTFL